MNRNSAILAFVREWDTSTIRVHCPFCLRTHSHGPGSLDFEHDSPLESSLKRRRAPHCGHLLDDYQICFPFEDAARDRGYSWFIDKIEQKYVTVGLPPEVELENYFVEVSNGSEDQDHISNTTSDSTGSGDDNADQLAEEFQAKANIDDVGSDWRHFNQQEMADPGKRKSWFISHCLLKETARVRHMLQEYKEDKLFDHRDRYGDDVMSLVAMEGHVCVMELLHNAGAGVSNVSNRGRTPLMEAALWGREHAVKFLLEKMADPLLRDHKGRTALDLAQDADANRSERGVRGPMYTDSKDLMSARVRIFARLENLTRATAPLQADSPHFASLFNGHFRQTGLDLAWYDRVIPYDLDYLTRTIGILSYNGHTMAVTAMSGANHYQPHPQILDNGNWTLKVRDICVAIGFDLRPDHRDRLFQGSFNAYHAEKQLLAYHIDRHFFWGLELSDPDVVELERLRPVGRPPKAFVVVSRPVCEDCDAFIRGVRENFAVEVEVLSR